MDQRQLQIGGDLEGVAPEWGVEQEENSYEGDISARRALVKGKIAASVRLGNSVGLSKVTELAERAGIESKLKEGFAVTSLAGTTGRWLVVLSKGTKLKDQVMSKPGDYPGSWIKERW